MSETQKKTKKNWGTGVHICLQYLPQGYCPVSPPQHLETNLPIKLRRLFFPHEKEQFHSGSNVLHKQTQNWAMERLLVNAGQEHSCCRGWWDRWGHCSPASAWSPARHTQRPRQQTAHTAWQMLLHFKQLKLPHAESPETESGPEHIFIALLKHAWMQEDTVKRDGDVLLLPPIISKKTWREEVLQKWVGRKRCCWHTLLARPRQHCKCSTGDSSVQPGTHWLACSSWGGWVGKSCLGKQIFPCLAWGSEIRPLCFWKEVIPADSMPVTNERLRKKGKGLTCILNLNTDICKKLISSIKLQSRTNWCFLFT